MRIPRGTLLASSPLFLACVVIRSAVAGETAPYSSGLRPFSFEKLVERASERATRPFVRPFEPSVSLENQLNYDDYRAIRYDRQKAVWRGESPFELQFYHSGYLFPRPVEVILVEEGHVPTVRYDETLFTYKTLKAKRKAALNPGFAGFNVQYAINSPDRVDEFVSFLGASYFRAVPRSGRYGTSARGLAVDIGLSEPEEFPEFRAFWVERTDSAATVARIYAAMDSPSLAGAFRFECEPGEETVIEVESHIFMREAVERLGVAPLTSEFFFGENQPARVRDPMRRPEVHDCDGLLIATGTGEWLWRPLRNPLINRVHTYAVESLRGFGLLQRDRDPKHYGGNTLQHLRPSVWVEPIEGFGAGAVQLLELSATKEWTDNIAVYWVPAELPGPGDRRHFRYRVRFSINGPTQQSGATVLKTASEDRGPNEVRYVLEFADDPSTRPGSQFPVSGVVAATGGNTGEIRMEPDSDRGLQRLSFDVTRPPGASVILRAFLRAGPDTLSETWTDTWEP
ncbi:MAG: glucan biosynthesis protein [Candidatus Hydrogenedentes bacterium]|nr:glucan biosynthesis protein [Candidatus Hydrogenedentota bacterium]